MPRIYGIDYSASSKNWIINGAMEISQRGTSLAAAPDSSYILDRFIYYKNGAMVHTMSQDTDAPTFAQANYYFKNSLRLNLTTPDTSIAAGDYCTISQLIEGNNYAKFAQKPFVVSFWCKATLAGVYTAFATNNVDRSCVKEFTINASNTWEFKTISFPAPPSAGTWDYSTGIGIEVGISLACGSTLQTTPDTWQTGVFCATSSAVNGVNTGATDFRFTGFQVTEGLVRSPFSLFGEDFEGELSACQRYYEKSYPLATAPGTANANTIWGGMAYTGSYAAFNYMFKVSKRNTPTIYLYDEAGNGGTGGSARVSFRDGASLALTNNVAVTNLTSMTDYFRFANTHGGLYHIWSGHFVANAELV